MKIESGRAGEQLSTARQYSSSTWASSTTTSERYYHNINEAVASEVTGKDVVIGSRGGSAEIIGSVVVADNDLVAIAKEDVRIVSDKHTRYTESDYNRRRNGLMSSGGIGLTIGAKKEQVEQDYTQESALAAKWGV